MLLSMSCLAWFFVKDFLIDISGVCPSPSKKDGTCRKLNLCKGCWSQVEKIFFNDKKNKKWAELVSGLNRVFEHGQQRIKTKK